MSRATRRARELGLRVKGRAGKVALTVDADDTTFEHIVESLKPDMLQLHGKESLQRILTLKRKFGLPVMKAIAIETKSDLDQIKTYARVADRLLFDARAPRDAARRAASARRSTGRCSKTLIRAFRSCFREASTRTMSPKR